ncbi:unnamed protein product, partial [Tetraodon nigroviridis]
LRVCSVFRLQRCSLSQVSCASLAAALKSNPSRVRKLELSDNRLQDSGAELLCAFLEFPECRLESLRLRLCGLTHVGCASLASALRSNPAHLRELELSYNQLQDAGVELLCGFLQLPQSPLETLRLRHCGLSPLSCAWLKSALEPSPARLKELELSYNKLQDSGVQLLCELLQIPQCRLETLRSAASADADPDADQGLIGSPLRPSLRLRGCTLSGDSCTSLASALRAKPDPSHLRELELSYNKLQ